MSKNLLCNLNGTLLESRRSPYSSADDVFRLRYGLYETYLFKNGVLEFADLHWQRLLTGMKVLDFVIPEHYVQAFFTKEIEQLSAENGHSDLARIRLQLFTDDTVKPFAPQYLIECTSIAPSITEWSDEGIKVSVLNDFTKEINVAGNCKISHNKHFLPARDAMEECQVDDVLLLNEKGNIAESSIANIFWIKEGIIFTPPLSEACLAGTVRAALMNKIKELNIPFEEKEMSIADMENADEIFLTNSIRKIRWVREIDGWVYGNEIVRDNFWNKIKC